MVDGLVFISRTDGQPLLDGVEEAQDHWKRNLAIFLADSLLQGGEGGCLPAFVLDAFFNAAPKSLIGLREAIQGGLLGE